MRRFSGEWMVTCLGAVALVAAPWLAYPQAKPAPADRSGGSVAITDVTVIDVTTGGHRTGVTVLIRGERIAAIGPGITIPRGASRVNGKGKILIPGLWDMHTHHQGTGVESVDLFVARGVIGTRDMGADADFILLLRERVNSGAVLGPEIVASGPMLDDAPPGFPYRRRVTNAQEAREAVRDLKQRGVDFIKVHDHTPREVFFEIADEAKKVGLSFAGHVSTAVTVEEAADAGIRSIEHLANYRVFDECSTGDTYSASDCARLFDKLAAKGVWQTPTMAFFSNHTRCLFRGSVGSRRICQQFPAGPHAWQCRGFPSRREGPGQVSPCGATKPSGHSRSACPGQPLSRRMRRARAGLLPSR
jgi:hypothetical protein